MRYQVHRLSSTGCRRLYHGRVRLSTAIRGGHVAIHGPGVAASCCGHLLGAAGFSLSHSEAIRQQVPAILLSEGAQTLLSDLYGQPDLFHGLFRIDRRIVAWGRDSAPVTLPHRAVVISEQALLSRLHPKPCTGSAPDEADWTVYASRPLPVLAERHHFGSRTASTVAVELKSSSPSACWIESLEGGWLFLIPTCAAAGWLVSVGSPPEVLLSQSRLIANQVQVCGDAGATFPAYPGIVDPFCSPGWLACGAAALSFDPLCGDGTGNAVREAILAAAVIRAAAAGESVDRLLSHYRARLVAGFLRHLELCRGFYISGSCGPWWEREIASLEEGIAWCRGTLGATSGFHYRLQGFELLPIN
jgi:hypothetical protein